MAPCKNRLTRAFVLHLMESSGMLYTYVYIYVTHHPMKIIRKNIAGMLYIYMWRTTRRTLWNPLSYRIPPACGVPDHIVTRPSETMLITVPKPKIWCHILSGRASLGWPAHYIYIYIYIQLYFGESSPLTFTRHPDELYQNRRTRLPRAARRPQRTLHF